MGPQFIRETFTVTNPALYPNPESELATMQSMSEEDFNSAIESADIAFNKFKRLQVGIGLNYF